MSNVLENEQVSKWLSQRRTPNTRRTYGNRMTAFFEWCGKSVEEFLSLSPQQLRDLAIEFQNTSEESTNSVLATFACLNSFLHYHDKPSINFQGAKFKPQMDLKGHLFSNGDLQRMFAVADTRDKALLAVSCSLGWEVSAVLELSLEQMTSLVKRAESEKQRYVYFMSQRRKTNAPRLGVLNPVALEWLSKWLNEKGEKVRARKENKKTADRPVSEVFDLTCEACNDVLRRLAKRAQIVTSGHIHFHKIRGWVMSGLSRAGFNEFEMKYLLGKSIASTDRTYLQTLQLEIEEKYPTAFEKYLNISTGEVTPAVENKQNSEIESLKAQLKSLNGLVEQLLKSQTGDVQTVANGPKEPILVVNQDTIKKIEDLKKETK